MAIKEIYNSKDGNKIEALIFERIQKHIFMLYSMKPLQCISIRLLSVLNYKHFDDGIYLYMVSEHVDFIMRFPEYIITKMIAQEFYTPFHEENVSAFLKSYIDEVEKYKNLKSNGVEIKNNGGKVLLQVHFKQEKKNWLKSLLEGLKLW